MKCKKTYFLPPCKQLIVEREKFKVLLRVFEFWVWRFFGSAFLSYRIDLTWSLSWQLYAIVSCSQKYRCLFEDLTVEIR